MKTVNKQSQQARSFNRGEASERPYPNYWDLAAVLFIILLLVLLTAMAKQMITPYHIGDKIAILLSPDQLPKYALLSVTRMFIALLFSLLFTFIVGTLAAKNRFLEKLIIPMIDVMQSIPVLGMLSITIGGFIALFPHTRLGPECAAIFAIFTAQVWNIALSFYQSLKLLPKDFQEASKVLQLSSWQHFWWVEVPFAMPALIWNTMISLSAGWFFVVASEAISVAHQSIMLPGIGSYIAQAILTANLRAIGYAILTMMIVILMYDQLIFRPILAWADKFKLGASAEGARSDQRSWLVLLFQNTQLIRYIIRLLQRIFHFLGGWLLSVFAVSMKRSHTGPFSDSAPKGLKSFWGRFKGPFFTMPWWVRYAFLLLIVLLSVHTVLSIMSHWSIKVGDLLYITYLGAITGLKIALLTLLCVAIWLPVGVWIGFRPRLMVFVQPAIQILSAFPANLLFPLVVMLIVHYRLNVEIWTAPLMVLGTQWYILFNVIVGARSIPIQLNQAVSTLQVGGWLRWRYLLLPAIFPYLITGIITAVGGAWNASIVAEAVSWGDQRLNATGLGALIQNTTTHGDFVRLSLGILVMCFYVLIINRLVWRPLYRLAENRFQLQ